MFNQGDIDKVAENIKTLITVMDHTRRHPQIFLEDDHRLTRIKGIVQQHSEILSKELIWEDKYGDVYSGSILHMASFYNHPALVNYLVKEAGMDLRGKAHNGWTALHHAARAHARWAVQELVDDLNANPRIKTIAGESAYDVCKTTENNNPQYITEDWGIDQLMRVYHNPYRWRQDAEERQKEIRRQTPEFLQQAEEQKKAAGTWIVLSPTSLEHVYQSRGEQTKRLTDVFNLATKQLTRTTADLKTGQVEREEKHALNKTQLKELKEQIFVLGSNKPTTIKRVIPAPIP